MPPVMRDVDGHIQGKPEVCGLVMRGLFVCAGFNAAGIANAGAPGG